MRAKRYFQLCFFLPLLLPLALLLFARASFRGWGALVLLFEGSLLIGGIPYAIFLVGLFLWMRGKSYRQVKRFTYLAPLYFVLTLVTCALALVPIQLLTTGAVRVEAGGLIGLSVLTLAFGYFYVLLTNGGFYLLRALGYIREEAEWERASPGGPGFKLGRKGYLVALVLSLAILLIPVIMLVQKSRPRDYSRRIAESNSAPPYNRDNILIDIAYDQAAEGLNEEARSTVRTYVVDEDRGFATVVTSQVQARHYEEAKATATLIASPETRLRSFTQIAVAQAEAGDKPGASRTLRGALDTARVSIGDARLRNSLVLIVVAGQAEAGLDDDLKGTMRLIDAAELMGAYKLVGTVYARRGRPGEAGESFREAVKLAAAVKDPHSRDENLYNISEAQADAGLYEDASATIGMIAGEGYRKAALDHLSITRENRERQRRTP